MPNKAYQLEAAHENRIKNAWIYREHHNAVRSAASRGKLDVVAWDETELVLIASQRVKWHPLKMRDIIKNAKKTRCKRCGEEVAKILFYEGRRIITEDEAKELIKSYLDEHPEYA
jgi:hypothetical protein